jgi:penicillin-binding protein 2
LQLAVMAARLANGGLPVIPRLTHPVQSSNANFADYDLNSTLFSEPSALSNPDLGITPAHLKLVRAAMEGVTANPLGTAFKSRIRQLGKQMAGKTGTVQVRRISSLEREKGVRKNKDLPWRERDHAAFVGFAPIHSPRYAISIVLEHGGSSSVAAAIARDILVEAQGRKSAQSGVFPKGPKGPLSEGAKHIFKNPTLMDKNT